MDPSSLPSSTCFLEINSPQNPRALLSIAHWKHKMWICRERNFTMQSFILFSVGAGSSLLLPTSCNGTQFSGIKWVTGSLWRRQATPSTTGSILSNQPLPSAPPVWQERWFSQGGRGRAGLPMCNRAWSAEAPLKAPPDTELVPCLTVPGSLWGSTDGWEGGPELTVKHACQPHSAAQSLTSFRQVGQLLSDRECQAMHWTLMGARNGRDWVSVFRELTGHRRGMFEWYKTEPVPKEKATQPSLEGLEDGEFKARV